MRRLFVLVADGDPRRHDVLRGDRAAAAGVRRRARALEVGRRGPERVVRRRARCSRRCRRAGWRRGSGSGRRCSSGSALLGVARASSSPSPTSIVRSRRSPASPRASAAPAPGPAGSRGCWRRARASAAASWSARLLAVAIVGLLLGPVIGVRRHRGRDRGGLQRSACSPPVLAAWVLATPGVAPSPVPGLRRWSPRS